MTNTGSSVLAEVIAALKQRLGDSLVAIVLFGSRRARRGRRSQDWDLLVIAHQLPTRQWSGTLR